jgi:hypothetical protein
MRLAAARSSGVARELRFVIRACGVSKRALKNLAR